MVKASNVQLSQEVAACSYNQINLVLGAPNLWRQDEEISIQTTVGLPLSDDVVCSWMKTE